MAPANLTELIQLLVNTILQPFVALIMILALLYFLIGVVKYIKAAASEDGRAEGRQMMIYGLIGLFVMVSVWGLVLILHRTFPLQQTAPPTPQSRIINNL